MNCPDKPKRSDGLKMSKNTIIKLFPIAFEATDF